MNQKNLGLFLPILLVLAMLIGYANANNSNVTYFVENGLPSGATWNVAYNGNLKNSTSLSWLSTNPYPLAITEDKCVSYRNNIYCVGGVLAPHLTTNAVYYSTISSNGIDNWTQTTAYPISIAYHSCTVNNDYIYCIGGSVSNGVYYAKLASTGVGAWNKANPYPIIITKEQCVANNNYIYCIAGASASDQDLRSSVYYAPILSDNSVGIWKSTNPYPIATRHLACTASNNYVYCVGGNTDIGVIDNAYYAKLLSTGVGTWTATTNYPATIHNLPCANNGNYIYCAGGHTNHTVISGVWIAPISATGIGAWSSATDYPTEINAESCTIQNNYIYCVAGASAVTSLSYNSVYYSSIASTTVTTTTTTILTTIPATTTISQLTQTPSSNFLSNISAAIQSAITSFLWWLHSLGFQQN